MRESSGKKSFSISLAGSILSKMRIAKVVVFGDEYLLNGR